MRNHLFTARNLIVLALTAVFSLAVAQLTNLATQLLGSGQASTCVSA